jgi:hypothetical protein
MTSYTLRLFENGIEVQTTSVAYVPNSQQYPLVGDEIGDKWRVLEVISQTDAERCLQVEAIKPLR